MLNNILNNKLILSFIAIAFIFILLFFLWKNSIQQKIINREREILEEKRLKIEKQTNIFSEQIEANLIREKKTNDLLEQANERLHEIGNITSEEAKKLVIEDAKKTLSDELNYMASRQIKEAKKKIHTRVVDLLCSSFERYSSEIAFSKTVESIFVSDETASRIIGKDGRNINFFRRITGTDIIIGKGKQKSHKRTSDQVSVEISCFDSLRREVAFQTLKNLIENEKKITPLYIEKVFAETSSNIDEIILQTSENVLEELKISGIDSGMMKLIGKLKYRTSYGQNVLEHSIEVAKISSTIASELGLDPDIAKRAGLLHDIGKSTEDLIGLSHVTSGIMIAKKYNESDIVVNAIASHHDRTLADNNYSLIVSAADTFSAARPGARSSQAENYINRMKDLEEIGKNFDGVKKMYSFQAGREIWVIVDSGKVSDFQCVEILKNVRVMIEENVIIPGDINISLIREKVVKDKIVNSGRVLRNVKK